MNISGWLHRRKEKRREQAILNHKKHIKSKFGQSVLELLVNEETPLRLRASNAGTLKNLGWSVRGYRKRVEEILPDGMHVDRSGRIRG